MKNVDVDVDFDFDVNGEGEGYGDEDGDGDVPCESFNRDRVNLGVQILAHALVLLAPAIFLPLVIDRGFIICFAAMMILSFGESVLHCTEARVPFIDRLLASITGLSLLVIVWSALFGRGTPSLFFSLPLIMIGIALRLLAMRALGSAFRTSSHPVRIRRRDGVFRLRHPSEIGLLLLGFGLATLRDNAGFLVFLIVLLPVSLARIVREETCIYDALSNPEPAEPALDTE